MNICIFLVSSFRHCEWGTSDIVVDSRGALRWKLCEQTFTLKHLQHRSWFTTNVLCLYVCVGKRPQRHSVNTDIWWFDGNSPTAWNHPLVKARCSWNINSETDGGISTSSTHMWSVWDAGECVEQKSAWGVMLRIGGSCGGHDTEKPLLRMDDGSAHELCSVHGMWRSFETRMWGPLFEFGVWM